MRENELELESNKNAAMLRSMGFIQEVPSLDYVNKEENITVQRDAWASNPNENLKRRVIEKLERKYNKKHCVLTMGGWIIK